MDFMHYFVKLLMLKQPSPILLYGFGAPTRQQSHFWRKKEFSKKIQVFQYTAILDEQGIDCFLKAIESNTSVRVNDVEFLFNLSLRPQVLSDTSGLCYETNKPVAGLHLVDEFWAVDKVSLIKTIEQSFSPCTGRELRECMQQLFDILNQECGIDFTDQGGRLGNFEYYTPGKNINSFEVRKKDHSTIRLYKKHPIYGKLIVNCAFKNDGRWVDDSIKVFPEESDHVTFKIDEPVTHYKIKIWEKESGLLIYASECTFIMEIRTNLSLVQARVAQDPWTKELLQSASKHSESIQEIEEVRATVGHDMIHVKAPNETPWRKANIVGKELCSIYKKTITKGAFVPKTADKKGEIDSFKKIRGYMEEGGLKKVVLADPYFSVKSAGKLLARIPSTELEFQVITALSEQDPDTGKDNANAKEKCKEFILHNRNIFHDNLQVLNVLRGKNAAFHDRYLIRYFEKDVIDGFLLSNSLNSAGQSFPYVIAPLEPEICLQVAEYLGNLVEPEYQNRLPKNEKAEIEVLCEAIEVDLSDGKQRKPTLPFFLTKEVHMQNAVETCVMLGYFKDGSSDESFTVDPHAIPRIIIEIFKQWSENPDDALIALGESFYHSYPQDLLEIKDLIQTIPDGSSHFLGAISRLADDIEKQQKHCTKPIQSKHFKLWSIMNGNATLGSISHLVNEPGHVFYGEKGYWSSLYELLWVIAPYEFMHIMESVNSPLMLSVLLEFIAITDYNREIHRVLLTSKRYWMHDLAADWMWRNWKKRKADLESELDLLNPLEMLEHSAYILSQAAFYVRMLANTEDELVVEEACNLCQHLIARIVDICNGTDNHVENEMEVLEKIKDVEPTTNAWLIFTIAKDINDLTLRNCLLDRVLNDYQIRRSDLRCDPIKNKLYLELVAHSIHLRYGHEFSVWMGSKILDRKALNTWLEPYLADRDYRRWSDSDKIVSWDKQLLIVCLDIGYELSEKQKSYLRLNVDDHEIDIG